MKRIIKTTALAITAFAFSTIVGCKNNETNPEDAGSMPEQQPVETTDMDGMAEPETNPTLNDTNVSGTTSGEMEQVP